MKPNTKNRKPMYENEMAALVGMIATCNSCDRIIYEDENWKEQYKENGGYCKDCHESEEQETEFYEYLDKEDSDGTFASEPAKDESKEVKEGGELFTGGEWECEGDNIFAVWGNGKINQHSIRVARIDGASDESTANAALIAQSKNMYYAINKLLRILECERASNGVSLCIRYQTEYELAKEIVNKAIPKK